MSQIKECFTSRYEDEGAIMEVDYSQLEIIALAHLTGDQQLRMDICSGVDLHVVNAAKMFGILESVVSKKQRKIAKAFSFQLQYGAGARSMAKANGTSVHMAKQFIADYYHRYPKVKTWQEDVAQTVRESRTPTKDWVTTAGFPAGQGHYTSETGRKYVFREYDNDYARAGESATAFSSTQMKNYPVQGFATGDIVPMMLGILCDALLQPHFRDKAKLINTVHDSVLLDVKLKHVREVAELCKTVLEDAPSALDDAFGIEFDLPLTVSVEVGHSWGSMKEIDI